MTAKRDYKKEYAKFQSSPQKKKYRAELNKYNRAKGTYGNDDGKDASHKSGKISGYEAEGKNRGRREKSRLKGSKRKTEGVTQRREAMGRQTLREYIRKETKRALEERLSKRWNIVDGVGGIGVSGGRRDNVTAALRGIINKRNLERAVEDGNSAYIQQVVKKITALRHKLDKAGDATEIDRVDDVMMNLLRLYMQVRKRARSVNEDAIPVGRAQNAVMKALITHHPSGEDVELTDLAKRPELRGIHFGQIMKSVELLKKKGLVDHPGTTVSLRDGVVTEAKLTKAQKDLMTALKDAGPGDHEMFRLARKVPSNAGALERAAAQLSNRPVLGQPRVRYDSAMSTAQLMEVAVTITEAGEKDQHGGYYNQTYKGWKIYTLQTYDTPYYYATAQRDPKTGRRVFGPSDNYPGLRRLTNRMDKQLAKWGKKTLNEAEPTWGKPEPPTKPNIARVSDPKPVPEQKSSGDDD